MNKPPIYDVAISLLGEDLKVAEKIDEELPDDLSVFLYKDRQEEIAGRDGLDVFSGVFRTARLCVLLYRPNWGETTYTRLEEWAIKGRVLGGERDFLLLVRFGEAGPIPPWFPEWEQWIDYLAEGADGVARTIVSKLRELEQGGSPWRRVTRRGVEHRPLPVSRYQRYEGGYNVEQFIPVESEVCDGCREEVRFRPLVRVHLWGDDDGIATEEQFCPPCAERRELTVMIPSGMSRETALGSKNPGIREHVVRLLRQEGGGILQELSADEELQALGSRNVGGSPQMSRLVLMPLDKKADSPNVKIPYRELEKEGALGEVQMFRYLKKRIREFLEEQDIAEER